jgi:hypothetical protein
VQAQELGHRDFGETENIIVRRIYYKYVVMHKDVATRESSKCMNWSSNTTFEIICDEGTIQTSAG